MDGTSYVGRHRYPVATLIPELKLRSALPVGIFSMCICTGQDGTAMIMDETAA